MKPVRVRRNHSYYDDFPRDPVADYNRRFTKRLAKIEAGKIELEKELASTEKRMTK